MNTDAFHTSGTSPTQKRDRKPAKRLFNGVVGSPLNDVSLAEPPLLSAPEPAAPVKRGRPPKYGVAMTPAEQKRRKREENVRRDLLADLMQRFRRMQQRPFAEGKNKEEAMQKAFENLAFHRNRFYTDICELPIEQLKETRDVWAANTDRHGSQKNGRREVSTNRPIDVVADGKARSEELGYRRVKPSGFDPNSDTADFGGYRSIGRRAELTAHTSLDAVANKMPVAQERAVPEGELRHMKKVEIVAWWLTRSGVCSVCGIKCNKEHIWAEYWRGEQAQARREHYDDMAKSIREVLHTVSPDVAQHISYEDLPKLPVLPVLFDYDKAHWEEIQTLLRKKWKFFGGENVDTDASDDKDSWGMDELCTNEGWIMFSVIRDQKLWRMPSQEAIVSYLEKDAQWAARQDRMRFER
jgi:hypothetical protein